MNENETYINANEFSTILDTMYDSDGEFLTDDYIDGFNDAISAVIKRLDTMPKIDVAPVKHGHWDNISESCSVCGSHWAEGMVMNADDWGYFDPMPAYCPYCGCKMDEGDDTE